MANKDQMMWLLSSLVRMMDSKSFDQLQVIADEYGLDLIISNEFLDYCRHMKNVQAVIFVASLAVSNASAKNRPQMVLKVYQSILGKKLTPEIAQLPASHVIRTTVTSLIDKKTIHIGKPGSRRPTGTGQDWLFSLELCMDHDALGSALVLMEAHLRGEDSHEFLLLCATAIVARAKIIMAADFSSELMTRWIRFVTALYERMIKVDFQGIAFELSQLIASLYHKNQQYQACIDWCSKPVPHGFNTTMLLFRSAQAYCSLGNYARAITLLDEVLAVVVVQTDDQIDAQFQNADVRGVKTKPREFGGNAAASALTDLNELMKTADIVPFLVSGTLLGFQRNGGFLPHDKDIDVGIFAEQDIFSVVDLILKSKNFRLLKGYIRLDRIYQLPVMHRPTSICIDIFVYYDDGLKLTTGVHGTFGYTQNFAFSKFGLQVVKFLDVEFAVPDDIPRNMSENYGNWEISDPYYVTHLESPSGVNQGGDIYMMVTRLEILKAIIEGKRVQTRRIAQIMRDHSASEWAVALTLVNDIEARFGAEPAVLPLDASGDLSKAQADA